LKCNETKRISASILHAKISNWCNVIPGNMPACKLN
jgi:hypothetical protein